MESGNVDNCFITSFFKTSIIATVSPSQINRQSNNQSTVRKWSNECSCDLYNKMNCMKLEQNV